MGWELRARCIKIKVLGNMSRAQDSIHHQKAKKGHLLGLVRNIVQLKSRIKAQDQDHIK